MRRARPSLDLAALRARYAAGTLTPARLVDDVLARLDAHGDPAVFLHVDADALRARARALEARGPADLPLWGVPFAIKDNIDLAGAPTTAACPQFTYRPTRSAGVVDRLLAAGALPVGKTNLDQFATGLVGVRSPYGAPRNVFDPALVPGGSSSGSAVAVAAGLVTFALGTDTAGSGRVPAALANVVGLKPTRGLVGTRGVVPACRTLDCVSVFALSADDAADVLAVIAGDDPEDPYGRRAPAAPPAGIPARPRVGVPCAEQREFFGDGALAAAFDATVRRLDDAGATLVPIDLEPFLQAARLLYEGPWVAERWLVVRELLARDPGALLPVTRGIVARGAEYTATDAFAAQYALAALARRAHAALDAVDVLLVPTVPSVPTLREVADDPIGANARLGHYTNFVNLLDLAAVAVPAGFDARGRPAGVTAIARAFSERALLEFADRLHRGADVPMGATGQPLPPPRGTDGGRAGRVPLGVCGAHMRGLPLEPQLHAAGARFVAATRTAPCYRLFALPGGPPARPGLVRDAEGGAIEVEVWDIAPEGLGSVLATVPAPLAIGNVELADGRWIKGFVCEAHGVVSAVDITRYGGWRRWLAAQQTR